MTIVPILLLPSLIPSWEPKREEEKSSEQWWPFKHQQGWCPPPQPAEGSFHPCYLHHQTKPVCEDPPIAMPFDQPSSLPRSSSCCHPLDKLLPPPPGSPCASPPSRPSSAATAGHIPLLPTNQPSSPFPSAFFYRYYIEYQCIQMSWLPFVSKLYAVTYTVIEHPLRSFQMSISALVSSILFFSMFFYVI